MLPPCRPALCTVMLRAPLGVSLSALAACTKKPSLACWEPPTEPPPFCVTLEPMPSTDISCPVPEPRVIRSRVSAFCCEPREMTPRTSSWFQSGTVAGCRASKSAAASVQRPACRIARSLAARPALAAALTQPSASCRAVNVAPSAAAVFSPARRGAAHTSLDDAAEPVPPRAAAP
eukprot:scaffold1928_cov63-Phaeocystis_antarctica.AAC.2